MNIIIDAAFEANQSIRQSNSDENVEKTRILLDSLDIFERSMNAQIEEKQNIDGLLSVMEGDIKFFISKQISASIPEKSEGIENVFDRYVYAQKRLIEQQRPIALRIEEIDKKIESMKSGKSREDIEKIEKIQNRTTRKALKCLENNVFNLTKSAFSRFYSRNLDAHPKLNKEICGSPLDEELLYMSEDLWAFLEEEEVDLEKVEEIKSAAAHLQTAATIQTFAYKFPEQSRQFYEEIDRDVIPFMTVGERILLPGQSKMHAFLYEIKRLDEENYLCTIINTGDDAWGWAARGSLWSKMFAGIRGKYLYAHQAYSLPAKALTPEFFKKIDPKNTGSRPAPEFLAELSEFVTAHGGVSEWGRMHQPQQRGNCSVKAVSSWVLGFFIENFGEQEGKKLYFKFKAYQTRKDLEAIRKLEKQTPPEVLKELYTDIVYDRNAPRVRYQDRPILEKIKPDEKTLQERLDTMYALTETVLRKREQKAQA